MCGIATAIVSRSSTRWALQAKYSTPIFPALYGQRRAGSLARDAAQRHISEISATKSFESSIESETTVDLGARSHQLGALPAVRKPSTERNLRRGVARRATDPALQQVSGESPPPSAKQIIAPPARNPPAGCGSVSPEPRFRCMPTRRLSPPLVTNVQLSGVRGERMVAQPAHDLSEPGVLAALPPAD
jgi:hypothetical protein